MSYPLTIAGPMPSADWTAQNPTLDQFELGFESDTGKTKLGDGLTAWADLGYWNPSGGGGGGGTFEAATNSPANGTDTIFTFTGPPVLVFRNIGMETGNGSVVGDTFVFDTAPDVDDVITALV